MRFCNSITKRKDGRYMGKFIIGYDDRGKALYQYVYGRTYEEAEEKLMIGREIESRFLSERCVSVNRAYSEWLSVVSNCVKPSTYANYKLKFEKHILPVFGNKLCSELTSNVINSFIEKKLADGLSASYVKDIIIVLKTMLKFAQEEFNFKLSLKNISLPRTEKKAAKTISADDQSALVKYLESNMSLTSFGVLISLLMGIRIGELCGLKWSDIDLKNKTLHIERTIQRITLGVRNIMYSVHNDNTLIVYLSRLKTSDNVSRISITAKECFDRLYDEARDLIAALYNQTEDEQHINALFEYQDKLSRNSRLYDCEKVERIKRFKAEKKIFTREDITESDIEHIICAAIPTDRHGNLTPSKASKLNEQFAGKRFSRQRIGEILSGNGEINRFDLITLNFFVFSQKLSIYPEAKKRFTQFLESTNTILNKCFMGSLYIQNPYECFILMCILSVDPLGTYSDVWELSYET